jgi:hypothetical protein
LKIYQSVFGIFLFAFISIILTTGSSFKIASDLIHDYDHFSFKNNGYSHQVYATTDEGVDDGGDDGGEDDEGVDDGGDDGGGVDGSTPAEPFDSNENNNAGLENQNTNEDTSTQSESSQAEGVQSILPGDIDLGKIVEIVPSSEEQNSPLAKKLPTDLAELERLGQSVPTPAQPLDSIAKPYEPPVDPTKLQLPSKDLEKSVKSIPPPTQPLDSIAKPYEPPVDPTKLQLPSKLQSPTGGSEDANIQGGTGGAGGAEGTPSSGGTTSITPAGTGTGGGTTSITPAGTGTGGGTTNSPSSSSSSSESGGGGETTQTSTSTATQASNLNKQIQNQINLINNIKIIDKNKIIIHDDDDDERQVVVVRDKTTCTTQSETVELKGKMNPKGIRLLAFFDPCMVTDGGVTLNILDSQDIKLAVLNIEQNGNSNSGVLINPTKIQTINKNQALFTIELDDTMFGKNPITGKSNSLTKINGLALYNSGVKSINLNTGNMAALTATLSK